MAKRMTSSESEISNEKSNKSENSLKESENLQPTCNQLATDCISRKDAIDAVLDRMDVEKHGRDAKPEEIQWTLEKLPSAQQEDYTELKREFIRMASYIDVLLECSDEQKETLIGFISRLAEFMPWTERD